MQSKEWKKKNKGEKGRKEEESIELEGIENVKTFDFVLLLLFFLNENRWKDCLRDCLI